MTIMRVLDVVAWCESFCWVFHIPDLNVFGCASSAAEIELETRGIIEAMEREASDAILVNICARG